MPEFTITRLGHLGDGLADGPEGPVLAPMTLPGEVIEGDPDGGRIAEPRILQPAIHRVRPPCRHFRSCGGCALQHAEDAFVADWKAQILRRALDAQGLSAPIRPIRTSPAESRIRAKLGGRRTKKGAIVGFHGRASHNLVEVPDCLVLAPTLRAVLPALRDLTQVGASRSGTLAFALSASETGIDCLVTGGKPLTAAMRMELPRFAGTFARLTWEDEPVFAMAPPVQPFGSARVTPPPGAFLQATREGASALLEAATEAIGSAGHIVELFAGCGTFTFPLAETARVTAYEGDAGLVAALDDGARHTPGLKAIKAVRRDLFRTPLTGADFADADAIVLDPPRSGAEAQIPGIVASAADVVAYISCNVVSFARDAKRLVEGGFRLDWVQPVDQFRWSPHLELAARFTRGHIAED